LEFIHFEGKCIALDTLFHCYAEIVRHLNEALVANMLKVVIARHDPGEFIAANDRETVCHNEGIKERNLTGLLEQERM
jgi:hypothetical protein